ncbi:MAG: tetraacyldisaccharide 4'-kinase [Candidatus Omnitrophota bacterium]|nr:MAG: tetraacyldisaccharide 4'-kinase [Candidatus Omnitrophota bacterium]
MRRFIYSLITAQGANRLFYVLFRPLLLASSFIYVNIVRLIRFFYRINLLKSKKPKSKVISVGNITWGGTGKSSLVALISRFLDAKNKRPAILIRGYGEDEDRMLKEQLNTTVLSGRDRIKNAKKAEDKYNADVLILDDGFQHWRIKRDLDIVSINATDPFGNGNIIPAGILREPISALKRADIIILTKVNLADEKDIAGIKNIIQGVASDVEIFEAEYKPFFLTETSKNEERSLDYIANKKLCAVAAIGDNNSFFRMLSDLSPEITYKFSFPDHHKYTQSNIKDIVSAAKKTNSDAIITTSKDWIRLKPCFNKNVCDIEILLLNIAIKIKNEGSFFDSIARYIHLPMLSKKGF